MDNLDVRQTHLSRLFFTDDRVYKQLKPVETPFVSFVDDEQRIVAATKEHDLNYRLAPDVYLGLADVEEHGELVDRMIVMRRLPDERQLAELLAVESLDQDQVDSLLREVARHVAAMHSAEPPLVGEEAAVATAHTLRTRWQENFEALEPLIGNVIEPDDFAAAVDLVERFLAGRSALFVERIAQGWVRDGHGDLRAEHVYCLDDGPRLIDCLAFRKDFRVSDVLNDVAFLAMDLHWLVGPWAAAQLMRYYHEFTNEHHQATLAHHYVAYRAHVRAKIAAVRLAQGDPEAAQEALAYHRLALQHLEVGRVRLVVIGGSVGVGKSTIADVLSDRLGATWLRTDEIRRSNVAQEQLIADPGSEEGRQHYDLASRESVYRELIREARVLLTRGESVVVDATWSNARQRQWIRELAHQTETELTELQVVLPLEAAVKRIQNRTRSGNDPSQATPQLARQLRTLFEPWPEATAIDNSGALDAAVDQGVAIVTGWEPAVDQPSKSAVFEPLGLGVVEIEGRARLGRADVLSYESIRFYLRRARYLIPGTDN